LSRPTWIACAGGAAAAVVAAALPSSAQETAPAAAPGALRTGAEWLRERIPEALRGGGFLMENWQWLGLMLVILVGMIVDRIVWAVVARVARSVFLRLLPRGNVSLVPTAVRPIGLVAMATVWWLGLLALGLDPSVRSVLVIAAKFVLTASAVWTAYRFTDIVGEVFIDRASETESKLDDLLVPMIRKSLKVFIVAFGLVFIADNLDVDISSLLAGLGLGGLAFALAAQDTVRNLFGSLTVLMDKPFGVGDWVVIGGDVEGMVEEVGFRSTRIRTFYNSLITVPNANLISTAVDNLGARTYRRWKATLSLTYDTPPERIEAFCEGLRELVRRHDSTRKDYFHVYANEFGAASLDVLLYVFFHTPDWGAELQGRHDLFLDILRLAREVGVEFAFPTQTLHVHPSDWEPAPHDDSPGAVERAREKGRAAAEAITAGEDR
jgi:MscS family membrane protein